MHLVDLQGGYGRPLAFGIDLPTDDAAHLAGAQA
jgi:hypothetical protein